MKFGQDVRQEVRPERRQHADPNGSAQRRLPLLGELDHILDVAQDGLRPGRDLAAERREDDLAAAALDELYAETVFELAQLAAERGLADVAHLGGSPKVQGLSDRDQVAKLFQGGHECSR